MSQEIKSRSGTLPKICGEAHCEASPSYIGTKTLEEIRETYVRVICIAESSLELMRLLLACISDGNTHDQVADIIADAEQQDDHSLRMYLYELERHNVTDDDIVSLAPVLAFQRKKLQATLDIIAYLRLEKTDYDMETMVFEFDFTGTEDL